MSNLADKTCEACRIGAPLATPEEIDTFMAELPDWQVIQVDGVNRLSRTFKFKNFVEALSFTDAVGSIAEEQNHHPSIVTEWGKVTVTWWTHKIGGLHLNDFVMAARTDELFGG